MSLLRDLWQEWVVDNPFLVRELRRWRRRGYFRLLPLWCSVLPAAVVLAAHWLFAARPPWAGEVLLLPTPGPVLFWALAALHFLATAIEASTLFALQQDAFAERLDFVRLLPMTGREMMWKIGIARCVLAFIPGVLLAPVYCVLTAYGGVQTIEILGVYVFTFGVALAPPGPADVLSARVRRRAASPAGNTHVHLDPRILPALLLLPMAMPSTLRIVFRVAGTAGARLLGPAHAAATGSDFLVPFGIASAMVRGLLTAQPFFAWRLPPVLPLGALWLAWRLAQTAAAAEYWSREVVVEPLAGERTAVAFPEATGRDGERRAAGRLSDLTFWLALSGLLGYFWEPLVRSGGLGALVGSRTPEGSLAALAVLIVGVRAAIQGNRVCWRAFSIHRSPEAPARTHLLALGRDLGIAALQVGCGCLLARVSPWPTVATAILASAGAASAALLFSLGWRAALGPAPHLIPDRRQILIGFLEGALLVGPILLAGRAGAALPLHLLAAAGPAYTFLSLLPGLAPSPLPLAARLALPAAVGAIALLTTRRTAPANAYHAPAARKADPLERWIEALAARWDNALLNGALFRLRRRPQGFGVRALRAGAFAALVSAAVVGLGLSMMAWSALSPVSSLFIPHNGRPPVAGIAMLVGTGAMLGFAVLTVAFAVPFGLAAEFTEGVTQRRLPFLFLSRLTDREIVLGTLAARLLQGCDAWLATPVVALIWLGLAFALGQPWHWGAILGCGVLLCGSLALHASLLVFHLWRRPAWAPVLWVLIPLIPVTPMVFGPLVEPAIDWLATHPTTASMLGILGMACAGLTLPRSLRSATRAVHLARLPAEVDLPPSQRPARIRRV